MPALRRGTVCQADRGGPRPPPRAHPGAGPALVTRRHAAAAGPTSPRRSGRPGNRATPRSGNRSRCGSTARGRRCARATCWPGAAADRDAPTRSPGTTATVPRSRRVTSRWSSRSSRSPAATGWAGCRSSPMSAVPSSAPVSAPCTAVVARSDRSQPSGSTAGRPTALADHCRGWTRGGPRRAGRAGGRWVPTVSSRSALLGLVLGGVHALVGAVLGVLYRLLGGVGGAAAAVARHGFTSFRHRRAEPRDARSWRPRRAGGRAAARCGGARRARRWR